TAGKKNTRSIIWRKPCSNSTAGGEASPWQTEKLRNNAPASGHWQAEACPTNATQLLTLLRDHADGITRNHHLDSPVLLPARRSVVSSHRAGLTHAGSGQIGRENGLRHQIIAHRASAVV